jgi:hypothetical protein
VAEHCAEELLAATFAPHDFVRGDANRDGTSNISDGIGILNALFLGEGGLPCADAADTNDDGTVNVSDPINLFQSLFVSGGALPEPSSAPGPDPTADSLICE